MASNATLRRGTRRQLPYQLPDSSVDKGFQFGILDYGKCEVEHFNVGWPDEREVTMEEDSVQDPWIESAVLRVFLQTD